MLLKISKLLLSVKEALVKADPAPKHHDQPTRRTSHYIPANTSGKEKSSTAIAGSHVKGVHSPTGEGRITPVQGDSRHQINQNFRLRVNPTVVMRRRQRDKLGKPSYSKKSKNAIQTTPSETTRTERAMQLDAGIPKVTPEQSLPKKVQKQESPPAPPEGNSQGQPLNYKFIDPAGKKYGSNRFEEKTRKKKPRELFKKSYEGCDIRLFALEQGILELDISGPNSKEIAEIMKKTGLFL